MAAPLAIPIILQIARFVGTRIVARRLAATAAGRAATGYRAWASGSGAAPYLGLGTRTPGVRNILAQPRVFGSQGLWGQGGAGMGVTQRAARSVVGPVVKAGGTLTSPHAGVLAAENLLYGAGAGAVNRATQPYRDRVDERSARSNFKPAFKDSSAPSRFTLQPSPYLRNVPGQTSTSFGPTSTPSPTPQSNQASANRYMSAANKNAADVAKAREQQQRIAAIPSGPMDGWAARVRPPDETTLIEEDQVNRTEMQNELAGISAAYNGAVNEIKSLYKLSETEEEKELLRYQLADLQAQVEAGTTAVKNLYSEKTANIQLKASRSRKEGAQASEERGQVFTDASTNLAALQEARNNAQVSSNRGLGIGGVSLDSDYTGLLSSMAPVAKTSAQNISDIGSQGLDYLGGLSESMSAARQGELQSIGASADAGLRQQHMQNVADRVAQERMAMAQQVGSIASQRAASIASSIAEFRREGGDPTMADMYDQLFQFAEDQVNPSQLRGIWQQFFPNTPISTNLLGLYNSWYNNASEALRIQREISQAELNRANAETNTLALDNAMRNNDDNL